MELPQHAEKHNNKNAKIAVGTGATSGTVLVFIAETFCPKDSIIRSCLIFAAPSISVFFTAFILWLKRKFMIREYDGIIEKAKRDYNKAIKNKLTSEEILNYMLCIIQGLEKDKFDLYKLKGQSLRKEMEII